MMYKGSIISIIRVSVFPGKYRQNSQISIREYAPIRQVAFSFVFMIKKERYYSNREFVEKLAKRIKQLRCEHNHSQEYLIDKVHLSINSYEVGSKVPTLMSILKICEFYGITIGEFFAPIDFPPKD